MSARVAAIVLTGGRGSRLGGADKAAVRVGGRPLGETVRTAAAAVAGTVVTVGPGGTVREGPPHAGPVAGLAAGLAAVPEAAEIVVVLACDLPDLDAEALHDLLAALDAAPAGTDAAVGVDAAGRDQVLLAAWRRPALAGRLAALGDPAGRPVHALYDGAAVARVGLGGRAGDVDTWDDVAARGPVELDQLGPALAAGIAPLPPRAAATLDARGALAEPLTAADAMPRMPVSAMDGYALAGTGPWRLLDRARRAGDAAPLRLSSGECVPIATGALAPTGADRALRHEHVRVEDGSVHALPAADGVDDLRPVGEDWPAGEQLVPAGAAVDAAARSVALSAGVAELAVRGPVRARVLTTGDEVLPADTPDPLPPGRIRDTAGPVLPGVLAAAGMEVACPVAHVPDDPGTLAAALGAGREGAGGDDEVEVVVLVGATGRGPADHLRPVLARLGARVLVDGVRMRPGGSQIVAELPGGTILLALPGNPLAAVCAGAVTGRLVVDALTLRVRTPELALVPDVAALAAPGRARVLPARPDETGGWDVAPRARTSHLLDLAGSAALAVIPRDAGDADPVELLRWA